MISGSVDKLVIVWDFKKGEVMSKLSGHWDYVN